MKSSVRYILSLLLLISCVSAAKAVSEAEMEQARATAAKIYLRWANDGSGYLDAISPKNMADLEKSLKAQEKTNIAAFKKISVPADYASWDKQKLITYWSETAFSTPGLNEAGKRGGARSQIKRALDKMSVSAPSAAIPPTSEPEKTAPKETPAADSNSAADPLAAAEAEAAALQAEMAAKAAAADSVATQLAAAEENTVEKPRSSSSTWIYVAVLVLLVAVVVALVVYASKTMRNTSKTDNTPDTTPAPAPTPRETPAATTTPRAVAADRSEESNRLRERFAGTLASKEDEIRSLNSKIHALSMANADLEADAAKLRAENAKLHRDIEHLQLALMRPTAKEPATPHPTSAARGSEARDIRSNDARENRGNEVREIFLGRVNSRGIFVRADRHLNPGQTIYSLLTTDGFSGSFRVVADELSLQQALERPEEWLGGGCVAKDLTDTADRSEVITESAGTAIFEDGTWRVTRKARIRYQ